ncbi:MAG TPA: polymorphic toxin-type HINT domain-containing protein [Thermoguttaceae bacterium]|nr:polymorphic toxin-type HINT domain-containing protein [Thermoguttaceae bacterium]
MIPRILAFGLTAGVVFTLAMFPSPGWADEPAATVGEGPSAAELTQAALEAEASGDQARRGQLLRQALNVDPQCASARGHAGYVRMGGEWLPVEEAERRGSADRSLAEYRRLRQTHAGTPTGELALARFCRDHDLDAEAKVHWLHVLQCQPNHEEALRSLGVRWFRGQLLTRAEIDEDPKTQTRAQEPRRPSPQAGKRWEKHWTPLVERWLRAMREGDSAPTQSIEHELQAIDRLEAAECLAAMAGLDRAIQKRCDWDDKKEQEAYRELSEKLVEVLDATPAPWTTRCLVQTAIGHPIDEVREAAADALGKRPMESYVPLLMAGMATPVEAAFAIVSHSGGGVSYQQAFSREGLNADYYGTSSQSMYVRGTPSVPSAPTDDGIPDWVYDVDENDTVSIYRAGRLIDECNLKSYVDTHLGAVADGNARRDGAWSMATSVAGQRARSQAAASAAATQRQVELVNAAIHRLNQRIQDALRRATGVDAGTKATDWWVWWRDSWYDRYELETPYEDLPSQGPTEKPVYREHYWTTSYVQLPSRPEPRSHSLPDSRPTAIYLSSCFARNTKVWTVTGPVPIEEVKVGDRVLSQDPESGELAYKPVLETTTRNPSPMVKVHVGSDVIEATRGHMFFVSGTGWRMAKELATGDLLRGVGGAVSIDRLEQAPAPGPWYEHVEESPDAGPGYGSAYNLIVDDFHTFFVGDGRVLAHDNTLFGRPYGWVPGLPAY